MARMQDDEMDDHEDTHIPHRPAVPRYQRINRAVIWCLVPLIVLLVLAFIYHNLVLVA
jgi:hypothetical protein